MAGAADVTEIPGNWPLKNAYRFALTNSSRRDCSSISAGTSGAKGLKVARPTVFLTYSNLAMPQNTYTSTCFSPSRTAIRHESFGSRSHSKPGPSSWVACDIASVAEPAFAEYEKCICRPGGLTLPVGLAIISPTEACRSMTNGLTFSEETQRYWTLRREQVLDQRCGMFSRLFSDGTQRMSSPSEVILLRSWLFVLDIPMRGVSSRIGLHQSAVDRNLHILPRNFRSSPMRSRKHNPCSPLAIFASWT